MQLSTREYTLIGLLVGLVVLIALYYGLKGGGGNLSSLEARVNSQENVMRQVEALLAEKTKLGKVQTGGRKLRQPLLGYVETLGVRANVKDRMQLNALQQSSTKGYQAVELKVDAMNLDEMVNLLYILESANPEVVIDQFEIGQAFQNKELLRFSSRILARQ